MSLQHDLPPFSCQFCNPVTLIDVFSPELLYPPLYITPHPLLHPLLPLIFTTPPPHLHPLSQLLRRKGGDLLFLVGLLHFLPASGGAVGRRCDSLRHRHDAPKRRCNRDLRHQHRRKSHDVPSMQETILWVLEAKGMISCTPLCAHNAGNFSVGFGPAVTIERYLARTCEVPSRHLPLIGTEQSPGI